MNSRVIQAAHCSVSISLLPATAEAASALICCCWEALKGSERGHVTDMEGGCCCCLEVVVTDCCPCWMPLLQRTPAGLARPGRSAIALRGRLAPSSLGTELCLCDGGRRLIGSGFRGVSRTPRLPLRLREAMAAGPLLFETDVGGPMVVGRWVATFAMYISW